jgi:hypothetical protein
MPYFQPLQPRSQKPQNLDLPSSPSLTCKKCLRFISLGVTLQTRTPPMHDQENNLRPTHSPGPTSDQGKQISSRNSTTHGMSCSTFFLLPDEKEDDFEALKQKWADEYKNFASPALEGYLDKLVKTDWLLQRGYRCVFECESALSLAEMNREPTEFVDEMFKRLRRIQRYQTSYETSYYRALRAIEAFRRSRLAEKLVEARLKKMNAALSVVPSRVPAPKLIRPGKFVTPSPSTYDPEVYGPARSPQRREALSK